MELLPRSTCCHVMSRDLLSRLTCKASSGVCVGEHPHSPQFRKTRSELTQRTTHHFTITSCFCFGMACIRDAHDRKWPYYSDRTDATRSSRWADSLCCRPVQQQQDQEHEVTQLATPSLPDLFRPDRTVARLRVRTHTVQRAVQLFETEEGTCFHIAC